ncbi:copper ion binding protein [Bacillus sp. FJAT-44742]|uniref:copper ion binding protein n=1 Tax=Bacillus sp. FJAT-44742 TaxID=2014005 RepID=UPI000C24D054|nr:copper ion binding protein [Bacillus sp. FJAT-44742]
MLTETFHVKGMTCGHCVSSVENSVGDLDGVEEVKVELDKGVVVVSFNSTQLKRKQIKEMIEDLGYSVDS